MVDRQARSVLVVRHCECQQPNLEKFLLGDSDYLQRDDDTTEKCCSSGMLSKPGTVETQGENQASVHFYAWLPIPIPIPIPCR